MLTQRMKSICIKIPEMIPQIVLITYVTTEKNIYEEFEKEIESGEDTAKQDFTIEYRCQPNKCQNQLIRKQIRNVVRDHYNLSRMYKVLKVKVQEEWREKEEEETTTTETTTTKTTIMSTINSTLPENDSISQYLSIYVVILYMLLLFVTCNI